MIGITQLISEIFPSLNYEYANFRRIKLHVVFLLKIVKRKLAKIDETAFEVRFSVLNFRS